MKLSFSKKKFSIYITSSLLLIVFLFSVVFYAKSYKKKFVFVFPSVEEGQLVLENRYFQKYDNQYTDLTSYEYYLKRYVDDLLLGSTLERTKLLFKSGTRADECFIRDDILYLNLSKDLLQTESDTVKINRGVELLNQNIKRNFKKIKKIELFVDGKYAFEKSFSN